MKYNLILISPSSRKSKKMMAVFSDKKTKRKKTIHFGASGYSDYTINKDDVRKKAYIDRHRTGERWDIPDTAGSLSRWILWEKKNKDEAIKAYKKRFNFL